jgi:hypothetical protein
MHLIVISNSTRIVNSSGTTTIFLMGFKHCQLDVGNQL